MKGIADGKGSTRCTPLTLPHKSCAQMSDKQKVILEDFLLPLPSNLIILPGAPLHNLAEHPTPL